MGRDCGFELFKLKDNKLEEAKILDDGFSGTKINFINIRGRCEATEVFLNAVYQKNPKYTCWDNSSIAPDDRFTPILLLNHPELDGLRFEPNVDWSRKLCFLDIGDFKKLFDFESSEKQHQKVLHDITQSIRKKEEEIEKLRKFQLKAQTEVAFDGFQKQIDNLKIEIQEKEEYFAELSEDDYDYDHYQYIKEAFEDVEKVIAEDPNIIVTAYASD